MYAQTAVHWPTNTVAIATNGIAHCDVMKRMQCIRQNVVEMLATS